MAVDLHPAAPGPPTRSGPGRAARVASAVRRFAVRATNHHADIVFRGPVRLGPGFRLDIEGPATFDVGADVEFRRRFRCEIGPGGLVRVGAGCAFTHDVLIVCSTSVEIGERCVFAQGVRLVDGTGAFRGAPAADGRGTRPIRIGDEVYVGARATVVADVGRRAVVADGAVVTDAVPAMCLVAGAPARVVEYFGPPDERPPDLSAPA